MIDKTTKEPEIKKATMIIRKLSADEKERRRIERYEDSLHDDATLIDSWEESIMRSMKAAGLDDKTIGGIIADSRLDFSEKHSQTLLTNAQKHAIINISSKEVQRH